MAVEPVRDQASNLETIFLQLQEMTVPADPNFGQLHERVLNACLVEILRCAVIKGRVEGRLTAEDQDRNSC